MLLFNLKKFVLEDKEIKKIFILGIPIFKKEKNLVEKKKFFLGKCIKYEKLVKEDIVPYIDLRDFIKKEKKNKFGLVMPWEEELKLIS